jgi:cytochrome c biogenesis protein CcmG, thiol:disulfide interchange protein DsbE
MRRRPVAIVALSVLVVFCITAAVAATRPSFEASVGKSPLDGHRAPPIAGRTIDGGHFSLASLKGRWVYVNFFSGWCVPCQVEAPELISFAYEQSKHPDGAVLVSVLFNDTVDSAKANIVVPYGVTTPSVIDPGGAIANAYGVTSPPTTFLINPEGVVVANVIGQTTDRALTTLLNTHRAAA